MGVIVLLLGCAGSEQRRQEGCAPLTQARSRWCFQQPSTWTFDVQQHVKDALGQHHLCFLSERMVDHGIAYGGDAAR